MEILLRELTDIALRSFLWFLLGASLVALAAGLWMLAAPGAFLRANRALSRWYSTRAALRFLDTPHTIERFFYRHHRGFGALLTAGALYALFYLGIEYDEAEVLAALGVRHDLRLAGGLLSGIVLFLVLGNLAVLGVGIIVFARPSLLKGLEARANRWISTRKAVQFLDAVHDQPDRLVARHPRFAGALMCAGSLYVLLQTAVFLL